MNSARRARPVANIVAIPAALTLLAALWACGKSELKPAEIATDELCARCRSVIAEKQYAGQFITKDGFVRKFDDISCMVQHAERVKRSSVAAFYAMDYASQQWVKGEDASFVRSDKFKTPQNGGILAFKDRNQAQALSTQYQAEILTLNDILK